MEITYKVIGNDGQEYGPISLPDLQTWVQQGRVAGTSMVFRSDQAAWTKAASLPELGLGAATVSAAGPPPLPAAADPAVESRLRSGASWFYWIAGLSLVNSIMALSGSDTGFILGLGITQLLDGIAKGVGGAGKGVAFAMNLVAIGVFVFFGVFAHKRKLWAFITGMVLYAMDGLIYLIAQDYLGLGFHAFALFCIFKGMQACRELK